MVDRKHRLTNHTPDQLDNLPKVQPRRLSRIVHDHKGNAIVEWVDAPPGYERQVFEIEGATQAPTAPYMRIPERERAPGGRTDLRKLSAWIKMMRELEEAKNREGGGEDD